MAGTTSVVPVFYVQNACKSGFCSCNYWHIVVSLFVEKYGGLQLPVA